MKRIVDFFTDFETYQYSAEEIDALFIAVIWPQVQKNYKFLIFVFNTETGFPFKLSEPTRMLKCHHQPCFLFLFYSAELFKSHFFAKCSSLNVFFLYRLQIGKNYLECKAKLMYFFCYRLAD